MREKRYVWIIPPMLYSNGNGTYVLFVKDVTKRGMKLLGYQVWIFVGTVLFFSLAGQLSANRTESVKRVLVLNSYHETYHWTDRIMAGVKSVFEPQTNVELYIDTKRSSDEVHFQLLRDLYAHKYALIQFDAIVSSDDNALNFLLKHRDDLFPGG